MKKRGLKMIFAIIGGVLSAVVLALAGLIVFLSATEYSPEPRQKADHITVEDTAAPLGGSITLYSWNIGYGGLGKDSDFFMDGGTMVNPPSQAAVEANLAGIRKFIGENQADAWLLQEVDLQSARSGKINELELIREVYPSGAAFAYNYHCAFVPIPLPPIGQVESGIATLTQGKMDENAERIALPCPFSWPVRMANLKRCLLVTRLDVAGTDKQLVLVNLHLEAYDDGEGKIAQTKLLLQVLQEEYEKGNYVIAGGDFNQTFPGSLEVFPLKDDQAWKPGVMEEEALTQGWQYGYDTDGATCRLLDRPLHGDTQLYVIDGFIVSPNVRINTVETVDLQFAHSDHNPVKLSATLLP